MSEMIEISGLWTNESKKGEKFFSGYLGNANILIFKNKFKDNEKHPDYKMYIAPKKKEGEATPEAKESKDDIPF